MGNLAVAQGASSLLNYYWEIYSIMGDPSLMPYFKVPSVNTATFPATILIGATSINITAAPYSRVGLTMGGTLYGTGIVPASGSLTLTITPFASTGTATLVITAQNKVTRIESITIAPNSGPYVNVTASNYNDSNNNQPEYNETGRFSPVFQNVGSVAATNVSATLTCSTPGITITDGAHSISLPLELPAPRPMLARLPATSPTALWRSLPSLYHEWPDPWVYNFSLTHQRPALALAISPSRTLRHNNGRWIR